MGGGDLLMEYYVYTDGSCIKNIGKAGAAFLIYTNKYYIGCGIRHIDTRYIMDAEFGAIMDAIKFLLHKISLTKKDNVYIHTDSALSIELLESIIRGEELPYTESLITKSSSKHLLELFDKVNTVHIEKVHAHKGWFNPNQFVDRLAKHAANMD